MLPGPTGNYKTIADVRVYNTAETLNDIQLNGLERINMHYNFDESDEIKRLYPDLFPSDELNVYIRKLVYDEVLNMYNDPTDNYNEIHERVLNRLQNIHLWSGFLQVNKHIFIYSFRNQWNEREQLFNLIYGRLWEKINGIYREQGYEFHYFGWLNPNNIYYKAKRGQIPLRPDTFEAGSLLSLYPGKDKKILEYKLIPTSLYDLCDYPGGNYLGWKKKDIVDAIVNSGLMKTIPYKSDPTKFHRVLEWKTIGLKPKGKNFYGQNIPGFYIRWNKESPSYSRRGCGLEAIYKKLYNTKAFINWPLLCSNRSVNYNQLKKVAREVFGIENTNRMKYDDLCQAITQVQDQVRASQMDLAKTAQESLNQVLLKPGSPWIQATTREQFKEGAKETNPIRLYNRAKDLCNRAQTKDELLQGITDMGLRGIYPENMDPYTKEDICEDLLYGLRYQAEKYGKIELYCENPDIPLDLIYSLAERAGLDAVLPTDWEEYTKEEICAILTRYLNILRHTKAPTLPRQKSL